MTKFLFIILGLIAPAYAADYVPKVGPDLERITVTCGEVSLLLRRGSQWTPGRIDFRGAPMTTEKSAYGTVFSFPGVGFIGTAHFENEPEDLQSVRFALDGKALDPAVEIIKGSEFRFERDSVIRQFSLKNIIELKDNRLIETTTIKTAQAVPLKMVYHFMHAWTPSVSEYIAGVDRAQEETMTDQLLDNPEFARKFYINQRVDWVGVFDSKSNQYAVSRLLLSPEADSEISMIWNVPDTYRKYYYTAFRDRTVPAGFEGTWKMVTGFGAAEPSRWKEAASQLAGELQK